jgi:hypothetical protein
MIGLLLIFFFLTFSDPRLQNIDLPNGIDAKCNSSINTRLVNIDYLLRTIRAFYQYQLNQILVYKPPDIYEIAKGYQTCK